MTETEAKLVLRLARQYLRAEISFDDFLAGVPEDTDEDPVAGVIDLIEHEPARTGLFAARAKILASYDDSLQAALAELEAYVQRQAPADPDRG